MKTKIFYGTIAILMLLMGAAAVSCSSDDKDDLPGAAGEIAGPDSGEKFVTLAINPISNAVTYCWYRDGEAVQNTSTRTYTASQSGSYTVAGMNANGEGAKSPVKIVTVNTGGPGNQDDLPGAAGTIEGEDSAEKEIILTIAEIERAETYRWYCDGKQVQESESRTYRALVSGSYRVAGVNSYGQGAKSPEKAITITDPVNLPAGATEIEIVEQTSNFATLRVAHIEHADSYIWYLDGEEYEYFQERECTAYLSGTYTVLGVNEYGKGAASPGKVIVFTEDPVDKIVGEWQFEGVWAAGGGMWANHKMYIDKIDPTTFRISNLTWVNTLIYDEDEDEVIVGDEVIGKIYPDGTRITFEKQTMEPTWNEGTLTWFAPMLTTDHLADFEQDFPDYNIVEENGTLYMELFTGPQLSFGGFPVRGFCWILRDSEDKGLEIYGRVMAFVKDDKARIYKL